MKKYSLGFIVFSITALLVIILCVTAFKPIDSLMTPPKLEGENLNIQLAFENSVESGYKLKSPINGDYRSAYISKDLNGDGQDEVIVFYSAASAVDIIRMNVLNKDNGTWCSVADFESSHSEIHQVDFADIDGDGSKELLVGWAVYQNNLSRQLNVYKVSTIENNAIVSVFDSRYSEFEVCDIDCNGTQDILIFDTDIVRSESSYSARFLTYENKKFIVKNRLSLDSSISSVAAIKTEYESEDNVLYIYVDGYKVDSGIITDVFYYDSSNKNFVKLQTNDSYVSALSSRSTNIFCDDINSDEKIEIPFEKTLEKSKVISETSEKAQRQTIVEWVRYENGKLKTVRYELINSKGGFRLNIPKKLVDKITVVNNYTNNTITFYELTTDSESEKSVGKALFSIKFSDIHNEYEEIGSKYRELAEIGNNELYYCIYENGENFNISKSYIEKMLDDRNGEEI